MWLFPDQPLQDFVMQGFAVKSIDEATQVYMRVLDTSSGESYELRQLDGQAKLVFKISPQKYLSGQTVCQGMLSSGQWVSDVCLTQIDA